MLNPDRLANLGAKGLTDMLEPLKAARRAAIKCTTPPAEVFHYIAWVLLLKIIQTDKTTIREPSLCTKPSDRVSRALRVHSGLAR